jgi:hypothetical protein
MAVLFKYMGFVVVVAFEIWSCYVAQAGLQLMIMLSRPPSAGIIKNMYLLDMFVGLKLRSSWSWGMAH